MRKAIRMPWGKDYIEICNMSRSLELKRWIRSQEWPVDFYRYRVGDVDRQPRKFTDGQLNGIVRGIRDFHAIVLKWVQDQEFSEDQKRDVEFWWDHYRDDIVENPIERQYGDPAPPLANLPPSAWWEVMEADKFGDAYCIGGESIEQYIIGSLFVDFFEDARAVKYGIKSKPQLCAPTAEPGTLQKSCKRLFRQKSGAGRN